MRVWEALTSLSSGSSPLGKMPYRVDPLPVMDAYKAPAAYNFSLISPRRG